MTNITNKGKLTHLKVGSSETPPDILIIQHLNLKCEIFLHILHNHNQKWEFYTKSRSRVCRACDICGLDIRSNNFKHIGLYVFIMQSFYMAIGNC